MEPITLIIAALAAGATAGAQETATQAVKDTYSGLKAAVSRLFGSRESGIVALQSHEEQPIAWHGALEAELVKVDAGRDAQLILLAQNLMQMLDAAGSSQGKYTIDARGAQGVQSGDNNVQHNVYTERPPRSK